MSSTLRRLCVCIIALAVTPALQGQSQEAPKFVADLRREDFSVYEDGKRQTSAIGHLVFDLLEKDDELFFVEFGFNARLTQGWTTERKLIRHALEDVSIGQETPRFTTPSLSRCRRRRRVATSRRPCS